MAKGPSFEREVCEKLSLWWTDGKRDDVFMRTSGSGGKATARRKKGKDTPFQGGDIIGREISLAISLLGG